MYTQRRAGMKSQFRDLADHSGGSWVTAVQTLHYGNVISRIIGTFYGYEQNVESTIQTSYTFLILLSKKWL